MNLLLAYDQKKIWCKFPNLHKKLFLIYNFLTALNQELHHVKENFDLKKFWISHSSEIRGFFAQFFDLEKCFKICYVYAKRKPK